MCIAGLGRILTKTRSSIWAVRLPFSQRICNKYREAYTFLIRRRLLWLNMQTYINQNPLKMKLHCTIEKNYCSIYATLVKLINSRHVIGKVFLPEAELAAITGHFIRWAP